MEVYADHIIRWCVPNSKFYLYLGICISECTAPIWVWSIVKLEIQPVQYTYPENTSGYRSLLSELPDQTHETGALKYLIDFEIRLQMLSSCGYNGDLPWSSEMTTEYWGRGYKEWCTEIQDVMC